MILNEYFHPLNVFNVSIFIFSFFVFDSIGSNLAHFFKFPTFLRTVYWIFGLGIFVFIWFLLHLFLPFDSWYIFITLLILAIVSLPIYFKQQGPLALFKEILKCPYPLIFLLAVIGYLFSIISLPPFINDELAYHYYSIDAVFINPIERWNFAHNIGLYYMLPRLLDTGYILFFSLTKTYATARLLHFLIFFSSIFSITIFLNKYFNTISAIIYCFLVLFIEGLILIESTFGHVDVGSAALSNLSLITISGYLLTKQKGFIYGAACLFGISIGIKYTVFVFISSVVLISFILLGLEKYQEIKRIINNIIKFKLSLKPVFKYPTIILFLTLIMGGYWYIKNLIVTGNPIYPFLFGCRNNIQCYTKKEFFEGWGISFDIQNFEIIKNSIFQKNNDLFLITVLSICMCLIASFITKNKLLRILSLMIPLTIFIEIMISRSISGFVYRYYYHWILLIPLALILPFTIYKEIKKSFYTFFLLILVIFSFFLLKILLPITLHTVSAINSSYYIQGKDLIEKYSRSEMTTSEWVEAAFPRMGSVAKWCGEDKPVVDIFFSDPKIKWFNGYEGGMYIYLINCKIINVGILPDDSSVDSFILAEKKTHPIIYYMSVEKCNPLDPPQYSDLNVKKYYETNQKLVCRGKEIINNLYTLSSVY